MLPSTNNADQRSLKILSGCHFRPSGYAVDTCLPEVYAIAVTGQFDRDVEEDLKNRGVVAMQTSG